jgi:hypothetical protein
MKTITPYSNIYMCMGHRTTGITSLSLSFGLVPRKLGWKPTYHISQLNSKILFDDSTNKPYMSVPHDFLTYDV